MATKIDSTSLRGSASRVNGIAGDLENELASLTKIINETSSAWEGPAKDSFEQAFNTTYRKNLTEMISSLRQYAQSMNAVANDSDELNQRGVKRFNSIMG